MPPLDHTVRGGVVRRGANSLTADQLKKYGKKLCFELATLKSSYRLRCSKICHPNVVKRACHCYGFDILKKYCYLKQRENLSMIVTQYLYSSDSGKGPIISIWTCSKRPSDATNFSGFNWTCRVIFDYWQSRQFLHYFAMLRCMLDHTYRWRITRPVTLGLGWATSWNMRKTRLRKDAGI